MHARFQRLLDEENAWTKWRREHPDWDSGAWDALPASEKREAIKAGNAPPKAASTWRDERGGDGSRQSSHMWRKRSKNRAVHWDTPPTRVDDSTLSLPGLGNGSVFISADATLTDLTLAGDLTLDGDVTSATLGLDGTRGSWLAGAALAHSTGEGTWCGGEQRGDVRSSLTGVYPYAGYKVAERLSFWAAIGHGAGELTLRTPHETLRTDIASTMTAAGAIGTLVPRDGAHGPELVMEADALFVRATSDAITGMSASQPRVSRLRLGLEGNWAHAFEHGAMLTPSLEAGVRHEGGDAETGFGVGIGSGVAFANASGRLAGELSAHALLAHDAGEFRDWGMSGSLQFDSAPLSQRGLTLTLRHTAGGTAAGGVDALMARETLAGFPAHEDTPPNGRLEAQAAYRHRVPGGPFIGAPYAVLGIFEGGRDYTFGWRLDYTTSQGRRFTFDIEGRRREHAAGGEPEHGFGLRFSSRW